MRLTILFSLFLLLTVSINATILQVSGDVSGTWNADTIQVIGDIQIPNNQTLLINPGAKVIFEGYFIFKVFGQIQANGLENDSISFFVSDTTGLYSLESNEGSWGGLYFEASSPNSDSSSFEFCNFKYGKAVGTDTIYRYGGAVCSRNYSQLRFSNCSFSNNIAYKNGGAIYCRDSNIKIEDCNIANNTCGTALDYGYGGGVCLEYSDAKIYRNYFTLNSSTGVGGGLSFEYANPDIVANIFDDNFSAIGGGLGCIRSKAGNSIVNNLFENNGSTFFGGGVAFLEADAIFTNNTVVNNTSMYAGGLYTNAGAKPLIKNCIVWNNTSGNSIGSQVYIYDVYSAPHFYNNNITGGFEDFGGSGIGNDLIVYDNNIDLDPQFVGTSDFPFALSGRSPCVNTGTPDTLGLSLPITDLAGNARIMEDQIDMGCYENQGNSGLSNMPNDFFGLSIAPNPITDQSIIKLIILEGKALEFTIVDAQAKVISVIPMQVYSEGQHQLHLAINRLHPGLYLLKAVERNSKRSKTIKLIVQ